MNANDTGKPLPYYNLVSLAAPFAGVAALMAFLYAAGTNEGHWYWTWKGSVCVAIFGGSCLIGLVCGIVAAARSEKLWPVTALGVLLNAPPSLTLAYVGVRELLLFLKYGM